MSNESKTAGFSPFPAGMGDKVENTVGFVALIDVLGFRELVGRDDQLLQVRQYVDTVTSLLDVGQYSDLQFVVFSDNLVINTLDDKKPSLVMLVSACSQIFFELARHQIAVRGAVAHGPFMRSPNVRQGVVVAGRPIVEANRYQHLQDWAGIMAAPSVVIHNGAELELECGTNFPNQEPKETDNDWFKRISLPVHLRKWAQIPFHSDGASNAGAFEGFAILPLRTAVSSRTEVINSIGISLKDLQMMKAAAPNPDSQNKYAQSERFLKAARESWEHYRPNSPWP